MPRNHRNNHHAKQHHPNRHRQHRHSEVSVPSLSYVDFTHDKDTKFSQLLENANRFLENNLDMKAKCLECYELTGEHNPLAIRNVQMDTRPSGYVEYGDRTNFHFRCLRMWVEPKRSDDLPEAQTVSCMTIIPKCLSKGGNHVDPKFQEFDDMINDLNNFLESNPLEGRILNIDTQYLKFHDWSGHIDEDQTYLVEKRQLTYYLTVLKMFYILGPPQYEAVGVRDFAPKCRDPGGFLSSPEFEEFYKVTKRGHSWLKSQPDKRLLNIQTARYKVKRSHDPTDMLETQGTLFAKVTEHHVPYVKVLRLFFVMSPYYSPRRAPRLTYRTFHPAICRTASIRGWPRFESQAENLKRVQAFLRYTDAEVLGAETLPVRLGYRNAHVGDHEKSLDQLIARQDYQVLTIRLYLNGYYKDPPQDEMPPNPELTSGCCVIS